MTFHLLPRLSTRSASAMQQLTAPGTQPSCGSGLSADAVPQRMILAPDSAVATTGLELIVEPIPGRISLFGELDIAGGAQLQAAFSALLACGPAQVVVDLHSLQFIDATGIGLLIGLRNALAASHATLRIVHPNAQAAWVFALCGLAWMLTDAPERRLVGNSRAAGTK